MPSHKPLETYKYSVLTLHRLACTLFPFFKKIFQFNLQNFLLQKKQAFVFWRNVHPSVHVWLRILWSNSFKDKQMKESLLVEPNQFSSSIFLSTLYKHFLHFVLSLPLSWFEISHKNAVYTGQVLHENHLLCQCEWEWQPAKKLILIMLLNSSNGSGLPRCSKFVTKNIFENWASEKMKNFLRN